MKKLLILMVCCSFLKNVNCLPEVGPQDTFIQIAHTELIIKSELIDWRNERTLSVSGEGAYLYRTYDTPRRFTSQISPPGGTSDSCHLGYKSNDATQLSNAQRSVNGISFKYTFYDTRDRKVHTMTIPADAYYLDVPLLNCDNVTFDIRQYKLVKEAPNTWRISPIDDNINQILPPAPPHEQLVDAIPPLAVQDHSVGDLVGNLASSQSSDHTDASIQTDTASFADSTSGATVQEQSSSGSAAPVDITFNPGVVAQHS